MWWSETFTDENWRVGNRRDILKWKHLSRHFLSSHTLEVQRATSSLLFYCVDQGLCNTCLVDTHVAWSVVDGRRHMGMDQCIPSLA